MKEQLNEQMEETGKEVLSEDALIYQKDREKSEKEKLAGMSKREKFGYFLQYYGLKTLFVFIAVCFVIYLAVHFTMKKEQVMGILAVNADGVNPVAVDSSYFNDFLKEHGYNPKKKEVGVNYSIFLQAGDKDALSQSSSEMVQALFFTQAIDVFLADEDFFVQMAGTDYVADLYDYLDEALLDRYKDEIVYASVTILDDEDNVAGIENRAVGIRITPEDNRWLSDTGWYESPVVLGLSEGSTENEIAVTMILEILE